MNTIQYNTIGTSSNLLGLPETNVKTLFPLIAMLAHRDQPRVLGFTESLTVIEQHI